MFVTADGGEDLEHFAVRDFDEARSILLQVREAATAERTTDKQGKRILAVRAPQRLRLCSFRPRVGGASAWFARGCSAFEPWHGQITASVLDLSKGHAGRRFVFD